MEYSKLGNTDIEVSKLCVGCMSFGKAGTMHDWTLDEARILPPLRNPTEKLFLHTIYSVSKLIEALYFVLIYTQKGLFQ